MAKRRHLEEDQQRYYSLFEHNIDSVYSMDINGKLLNINTAGRKMLGYSVEELSNMTYRDLVEPDLSEVANEYFNKALKGNPQFYETVCVTKNGNKVPLNISNVPIVVNGKITGVFGIAKDISKVKESENKYRSLFENNLDIVLALDLEGNVRDVNPKAEILTGLSKQEMLGMNYLSFVASKDIPKAKEDFSVLKKGEASLSVKKITFKNGDCFELEVKTVPIKEEGKITGLFILARDITEFRQNQKRYQELAFTDQVTGIPNRHWFYSEIENLKKKCNEQVKTLAILSIDFDNFKDVNDTLGHKAGDLCLKKCAERLKSCLRNQDKVSRVGGDEFVVIMENTTIEEVKHFTEKILKEMNEPLIIQNHELTVTLSIGISMGNNCSTPEKLLNEADIALIMAKNEGKNNFQFFSDEIREKTRRNSQLESALRSALDREEFELHYQPQIDIKTGKLVGLEALLRWNPSFGPVSPAEFIPIAEKTGLILPIGEWVFKEVCRQMKRWEKKGLSKVKISLNVSPRQFKDPEFATKVEKITKEAEIDPRYLEIEITESVMLDVEGAAELIREVKRLGIKIAIDDFGTGYSALSILNDIKIDTLKLDKSMVDNIMVNERKLLIMKGIITVASSVNVPVIVEGVELKEQVNLLERLSVFGQGYFFSRPLPPEKIESVWNDNWI